MILLAYCHFATFCWILFRFSNEFAAAQHLDPGEIVPQYMTNKRRYYIHYYYFIITTISTNGYGDILPNKDNTLELLLSMATTLTGLICMTMFISISNVMLRSFGEQYLRYRRRMKDM